MKIAALLFFVAFLAINYKFSDAFERRRLRRVSSCYKAGDRVICDNIIIRAVKPKKTDEDKLKREAKALVIRVVKPKETKKEENTVVVRVVKPKDTDEEAKKDAKVVVRVVKPKKTDEEKPKKVVIHVIKPKATTEDKPKKQVKALVITTD